MDNVSKISPINFEEMKLKITSIINGDPMALVSTEGIHRMIVENTDPIYPIKDKQNWFATDLNVTITRYMSRMVVP